MKGCCETLDAVDSSLSAEMVVVESPKVNIDQQECGQLEMILEKTDASKEEEPPKAEDAVEENPREEPPVEEQVPIEIVVSEAELHKELDFDANPSELYLLLQRRDWTAAEDRCKEHPEEATHWVSRKEADGKLRWRLLPIHGAIIFNAPEKIVKALLEAYPACVQAKDDQGMLPLHLSYRMNSPQNVVEVLLHAFPESIDMKDRKGRTPVTMAEQGKSPNKVAFLATIMKFKASRALSTTTSPEKLVAVSPIAATGKGAHDDEIQQILSGHAEELSKVHSETLEKELFFEEKILKLKKELSLSQKRCTELESMSVKVAKEMTLAQVKDLELKCKTQSKELMSLKRDYEGACANVTILEDQLKRKNEYEQTLVKQISNLAAQLTVASKTNDGAYDMFTERVHALEAERDDLRSTVSTLSKKLFNLVDLLQQMEKEQAAVVAKAELHQTEMAAAAEEHDAIIEEIKTQQLLFENAKKERSQIMDVLKAQGESIYKSEFNTDKVVSAVEKHAKQVDTCDSIRKELIQEATTLKLQISQALEKITEDLPMQADSSDEKEFVDAVVRKTLNSEEEKREQ